MGRTIRRGGCRTGLQDNSGWKRPLEVISPNLLLKAGQTLSATKVDCKYFWSSISCLHSSVITHSATTWWWDLIRNNLCPNQSKFSQQPSGHSGDVQMANITCTTLGLGLPIRLQTVPAQTFLSPTAPRFRGVYFSLLTKHTDFSRIQAHFLPCISKRL